MLTIFVRNYFLDVWLTFEYVSEFAIYSKGRRFDFFVPKMLFMQFISDGELEVVEIVFFEGKRRKSKAIEAAILQC